jgi:hypothetical protein
VIVLAAVSASGCGGGGQTSRSSTDILTRKNKVHGCSSPSEQDVVRISGLQSLRRVDFAFPEGEKIRCSTGYSSGGVSAVVSITERDGGAQTLRLLRSRKATEFGAGAIRPVPALGDGAFVAKRQYLVFLRGGRAVSLETGLGESGTPVLTVRELVELAQTLD